MTPRLPPLMESSNTNATFSSARKFRTAMRLQIRDKIRIVGRLHSYIEDNLAQESGSDWLDIDIDIRRSFCTAATDWIMHSRQSSVLNNSVVMDAIDDMFHGRPLLRAAVFNLILRTLMLRKKLVPRDDNDSSLETILSGRAKGLRATSALPFFGHLGYRISIVRTHNDLSSSLS